MSTYNNGLRFYKAYYNGINWSAKNDDDDNAKKFDSCHQKMFSQRLSSNLTQKLFAYPESDANSFTLATTYPGLIIGTGIPHGSGRKGEVKIGFHFDYTTGMPVIPGSSIKGVLRSVFPMDLYELSEDEKTDEQLKKALSNQANGRENYIGDLLKTMTGDDRWKEKEVIYRLTNWLFKHDDKPGPMSGRVIYHDAVPIKMTKQQLGVSDIPFLGTDFITPHQPLKNPNPIQFLKVLPGVVYRFQFQLHEYKDEKLDLTLKKNDVKDLFKDIIKLIGVGAKTNVGYGQLLTEEEYLELYTSEKELSAFKGKSNELLTKKGFKKSNEAFETKGRSQERLVESGKEEEVKPFDLEKHRIHVDKLRENKKVVARILKVEGHKVSVQLEVEGLEIKLAKLSVNFFRKEKPSVNKLCWVTIKGIDGKAPNWKAIRLETNMITEIENQ